VSRRTLVKIEIAFILTIPAWIVVVNCAGIPADPFTTVVILAFFYLLAGWALFLARVWPHVAIDWFNLGLAGACLAGLVCGLHFFFVWLHREITLRKPAHELESKKERQAQRTWKLRTTLSIIGIVVLMFVAGIAAVGTVHQLVWLRTRP